MEPFVPIDGVPTEEAAISGTDGTITPLGHWPLDEGSGDLLKDVSGRGNHARAFNLSWENGLLDFTSGFQWVEIPLHGAYRQARAFSMGGWFFSRRDDYLGGSNAFGPNRHEIDQRHLQGVNLMGNAYDGRGSWVYWGARDLRDGVALRLRSPGTDVYESGNLLGVIHANRSDVLDSAYQGTTLPSGKWTHVFYTYEAGRGTLYLDGEAVVTAENVPATALTRPFLVGNDMAWWMLYPEGSQSLHGSARDLMLFDRALPPETVATLAAEAPATNPTSIDSATALVEWVPVHPEEVSALSTGKARQALDALASNLEGAPQLQRRAAWAQLEPQLREWIDRPELAESTAKLLRAADLPESDLLLRNELVANLQTWLRDPELDATQKAWVALAAAQCGEAAVELAPLLREALKAELGEGEADAPQVEDFYRNALTRALLDLDGENEATRELLGRTLARPLLAYNGLNPEIWPEAHRLAMDRRWMDAMAAFREGDPAAKGFHFFTEGDSYRDGRQSLAPNLRAYSPQVVDGGVTYRIGSGVPWESAKRIDRETFLEAVNALPEKHREAARNWEYANSKNLFQLELHKELPDGSTESALLEGPWFIFEGHDQKMQGWTIDIDAEGHLHLLGGMHNRPIPRYYVPGSWEKMGFDRGAGAPSLMYWVSKRPYDISEFEFVGERDGPRNLPAPGMNYMNFLRDADNNMFLYGRISAQAIQSWGLYRYDAAERRWRTVGGDARSVVTEARGATGEELFLLRTGAPWQPKEPATDETVFAWAWQPHFYNYIRDWGARFDPSGRLHIRMRMRGLGEDSRILDTQVYAWSDDLAQSWHRADGSELRLPLTINPAPAHNASIRKDDTQRRWQLWISLLEEAGYTFSEPDPLNF